MVIRRIVDDADTLMVISTWISFIERMRNDIIPITLKPGHTLIGQICYVCGKSFDTVKPICLVPLGPDADEEAQEAAKKGKMYNAVAIPLHYHCATSV